MLARSRSWASWARAAGGVGPDGWRRVAATEPVQPGDRRGASAPTAASAAADGRGPGSRPVSCADRRGACGEGSAERRLHPVEAAIGPVVVTG